MDPMELVLCVRKDDIFMLVWDGYRPSCDDDLLEKIASVSFFMERKFAEKDESLRQIIPYNLITIDGNFLTYRRMKKSGEKRLNGMVSIGIGGHVNPIDYEASCYSAKLTIMKAANREIHEEISLNVEDKGYVAGTIQLNDTPVDRVHLGLVIGFTANSYLIESKEPDKIEKIGFLSPKEIRNNYYNELENWSKVIIDSLP